MLKDLESEKMMSKEGDRVERSRLFDAFLGSSSIWQPQPCRDHLQATNTKSYHDDFINENVDSNIVSNQNQMLFPQQKSVKPFAPSRDLWNVDAPPFYSSKLVKAPFKEPIGHHFLETLKRTIREKLLYQAVRLKCCSPQKLWYQENPNQRRGGYLMKQKTSCHNCCQIMMTSKRQFLQRF